MRPGRWWVLCKCSYSSYEDHSLSWTPTQFTSLLFSETSPRGPPPLVSWLSLTLPCIGGNTCHCDQTVNQGKNSSLLRDHKSPEESLGLANGRGVMGKWRGHAVGAPPQGPTWSPLELLKPSNLFLGAKLWPWVPASWARKCPLGQSMNEWWVIMM